MPVAAPPIIPGLSTFAIEGHIRRLEARLDAAADLTPDHRAELYRQLDDYYARLRTTAG